MKSRIDYWHNGHRHPIKLTAYARKLLTGQSLNYSDAITLALQAFLNNTDTMTAATAFIAAHDGMNLSLLIETAIIWRHHRP